MPQAAIIKTNTILILRVFCPVSVNLIQRYPFGYYFFDWLAVSINYDGLIVDGNDSPKNGPAIGANSIVVTLRHL